MKKLLASIAVISAIACPALAQDASDTAGGAPDVEFRSEISPDSIAAIPTEMAPDMDNFAVGVGGCSPLPISFSDEQLEKIAKIKGDFKDSSAAKVAQLHTLGRQLKSQLGQTNVDKSQVMDTQSKINNLKAELSNARLNMRLDTLALLTPEQKQKVHHAALQRQVMGGRKGLKHGGHHKHGKHGGPRSGSPEGGTPQA